MWEFIKFLGMFALILFLIGIIFAIINVIWQNIKLSILQRQAIEKLKKAINENEIEDIVIKDDSSNKEDVK